MVAGGTEVARSSFVAQPVPPLPALLLCVHCEGLPRPLCPAAVPGRMGTSRAPSSGALLGCALGTSEWYVWGFNR